MGRKTVALLLSLFAFVGAEDKCTKNGAILQCVNVSMVDVAAACGEEDVIEIDGLVSGEKWDKTNLNHVNSIRAKNVNLNCDEFKELVNLPYLQALSVEGGRVGCRWTDEQTFDQLHLRRLSLINVIDSPTASLKCSYVEELVLSNNNFTVFPTVNSHSVSFLDVAGNDIEEIANLKDLPGLEELNAARNKIKTIAEDAFKFNEDLERLSLQDNEISEFSLIAPELYSLDLSKNRLQNISGRWFKETPSLHALYLAENEIDAMESPFLFLGDLRILDLSDNELEKINERWFIHVPYLEVLRLNHNSLLELPSLTTSLDSLHLLNLSHNDLPNLNPKFFKQLPFLATLDISFNELTTIDGATRYMSNLNKLSAHRNYLYVDLVTFFNMTELNTLDLSANNLNISLDIFRANSKLRDIDLSDNFIEQLCKDKKAPPQILNLQLRNNRISSLHCLKNVKSLDIGNNALECGTELAKSLKEILEDGSGLNRRPIPDDFKGNKEDKATSWKAMYKSLCDGVVPELLETSSIVPVGQPETSPDNIIFDINVPDVAPKLVDEDPDHSTNDYDDDDDDEDDDSAYDDDEAEDTSYESDVVPPTQSQRDSFDAIEGLLNENQTNFWVYAALIFGVLCSALLIGNVILCVICRMKQRRAQPYNKLRNEVYQATTARMPPPPSNISSNLRIPFIKPVTEAVKHNKLTAVFTWGSLRSANRDAESRTSMISTDLPAV